MLSIILVNYHAGALLRDCLQSVYTDTDNIYEIIVVDNSVGDGAKDVITNQFPNVKWLNIGYNAGFARANNAGILASTGDAVLLLNPDTIVKDNAVGKCYLSLMQNPYVAAGVQLLNVDGSPQISGNYAMKGGLNYLMQITYIGQLIRWVGLKAGVSKPNLPEAVSEVTEVDWINGAFLMVKKSAIEKAGMLDEDFFLYHEESEWCSRLKKLGPLCIYGQLNVIHLEGQSSNQAFGSASTGHSNLSDKKGYQLMLSMFVRIRKEFGLSWYFFHLLFHTGAILFVLPVSIFHALLSLSTANRILQNAFGYAGNVISCWKYLPVIVDNKRHFYKVL